MRPAHVATALLCAIAFTACTETDAAGPSPDRSTLTIEDAQGHRSVQAIPDAALAASSAEHGITLTDEQLALAKRYRATVDQFHAVHVVEIASGREVFMASSLGDDQTLTWYDAHGGIRQRVTRHLAASDRAAVSTSRASFQQAEATPCWVQLAILTAECLAFPELCAGIATCLFVYLEIMDRAYTYSQECAK